MPAAIPVAAAAVGVAGSIMGGKSQEKAAGKAAAAQKESALAGIEEQRRQFDLMREILSPYVQAGQGSLGAQQALLGLSGANAQRQAIAQLERSPEMQALVRQGETAILQNASATGGLRGGNTQAALAQFRPQMLSNVIQNRLANLSGITSIGQASAAGTATAAGNTGTNVANLLQQQGAASAGALLAGGAARGNMWQSLGQFGGQLGGLYASGAFNSAPSGNSSYNPAGMKGSL